MADKIPGLSGGIRKAVKGVSELLQAEAPSVMSKIPSGSSVASGVAEGPAAQYLARLQPIVELKAKPVESISPGRSYETKQEGTFLRVRPQDHRTNQALPRGVVEEAGSPAGSGSGGSGSPVPQRPTNAQIKESMKDPGNFVRRTADEYSQRVTGSPYDLPKIPESSLAKQSAIGRTFQLAVSDDPAYKKTVFDAYAAKAPDLIERSGATNYDQLMEASYRQLAKETEDQFRSLPVNMSYHRAGEGNYQNSQQMLQDVYGNRHLYVFQGGDPHDFLNAVDPSTGLNTNEMFRAVHDFYGHAIHGNAFGAKGEEVAWAAHSKMFSPLARLAMTAETRGQNSFVNYTPLNADLKALINQADKEFAKARSSGNEKLMREAQANKDALWQEFQFAPQKSILLPPEYVDLNYKGGMPSYLQPLVKPEAGTTTAEQLTHFSHQPNLEYLDPARYGTGIKGAEMERLRYTENPVVDRAYFYTGDPSAVQKEPGLGAYRYGTRGEGLYDITQDPLKFRTLAEESARMPYSGNVNPGMTDRPQVQTDVERLIKEYGYEGLTNPNLGMAITYEKTPVKRYAKGGKVQSDKVRYPRVSAPALEALYEGSPMRQDVASAREPSAREVLAEKLQAQLAKFMPPESAKKGARKLTGYTYPMGVADITPAGIPLMAYEGGESLGKAAQAAGEGQYGDAALEGLMGALGLLPAAPAVGAAGKAAGRGVARQIDRAMMTGEGPLGNVLAGARPQFVTAYHGSPHQFDKFDMSKIGTGEGAQSYGRGLYFAESPGVAKSYRNGLTSGLSVPGYDSESPAEYAARLVKLWGSPEKAMSILDNAGERMPTGRRLDFYNAIKDGSYKQSLEMLPKGSLYKVDIPDEAVARMLDWDKSLSEQAPEVQEALHRAAAIRAEQTGGAFGPLDMTQKGKEFLPSMGEERLRQAGIPGIKYLDEGSRGAGEGTRNFVTFSDEMPRILEVNDKPTGAQPWAPGEYGRPAYPQAEALETARKNAVTMLGLPENNTAMDRARAMGAEDFYHASKQDIRSEFNPGYSDQLSFVTDSPEFANQWLGKGKFRSRIGAEQEMEAIEKRARELRHSGMDYEKLDKLQGEEFNQAYDQMRAVGKQKHAEEIGLPTDAIYNSIYPIKARAQKVFHPEQNFDDLADFFAQKDISRPQDIDPYKTGSYLMYENPEMVDYLKNKGYDAMRLRESVGGDYSTLALFDPSQVRSRFAAFDPARMNENDLLGYAQPSILPYTAGAGALGGLGLAAMNDKQPPKKKGTKNGK